MRIWCIKMGIVYDLYYVIVSGFIYNIFVWLIVYTCTCIQKLKRNVSCYKCMNKSKMQTFFLSTSINKLHMYSSIFLSSVISFLHISSHDLEIPFKNSPMPMICIQMNTSEIHTPKWTPRRYMYRHIQMNTSQINVYTLSNKHLVDICIHTAKWTPRRYMYTHSQMNTS